jgi:hypothetical protein
MNFMPGQQDAQATDQPEGGGPDLNGALEQGETTFVTGEPKKQASAGTLGVVGLLAICAAGTYFMYVRNGPAAASAADVATADQVGTFLADGDRHVKLMTQMLQNTDKVVQQFRQSSAKTQVPLAALSTNPFRMEAPKKPGVAAASESESAARRRRDEERAAVVDAATALKLQLLMVGGARRAALINDRMVYEGQEVDGLTVEKILPDKVVLRSGVYRVEKAFQK